MRPDRFQTQTLNNGKKDAYLRRLTNALNTAQRKAESVAAAGG